MLYIAYNKYRGEKEKEGGKKKCCNIDDDYENDGDDNGDEKKLFPRIWMAVCVCLPKVGFNRMVPKKNSAMHMCVCVCVCV